MKLVEQLLDAAFSVLAHDCDPTDRGSILQREALKERFERVLRSDPGSAATQLASYLVPKKRAKQRQSRARMEAARLGWLGRAEQIKATGR